MIEPQTPPGPFVITSEYLDYLIGILTGTVTPKAGAEFIPVLEIARAAQLGVAWAEVEAALGEDAWIAALVKRQTGWDLEIGYGRTANSHNLQPGIVGALGPLSALRALAEKAAVTGGVD